VAIIIVVATTAVDVVAYHSSIRSLKGWGRDGHGRGLLLLLSWTAFHSCDLIEVRSEYESVKDGFEALIMVGDNTLEE
jgi:hypothetical protein